MSLIYRIVADGRPVPFTVTPDATAVPTAVIYLDAALTMPRGGDQPVVNGSVPGRSFTYTLPVTLPAGTYYVDLDALVTGGAPSLTDTVVVTAGAIDSSTGDLDLVRLLISDLSSPPTFSDQQITAFLTLEGDNVKRAAASALDAIASNEALVSKRIRTLDLQTDGPAVAKALREHASLLRAQADDLDGGDFDITTSIGRPHYDRLGDVELGEWLAL